MFLNTCWVVPGLCQASVIRAGSRGALSCLVVGAGALQGGGTLGALDGVWLQTLGCTYLGAAVWVELSQQIGKGFPFFRPQHLALGPLNPAVPLSPQGSCLAGKAEDGPRRLMVLRKSSPCYAMGASGHNPPPNLEVPVSQILGELMNKGRMVGEGWELLLLHLTGNEMSSDLFLGQ